MSWLCNLFTNRTGDDGSLWKMGEDERAFNMIQTPENPRIVRMFDLLVESEIEKAMDIYWEMEPINEASMGMASVSCFDTGITYATMNKYYHWYNGGNGGMLRQPVPGWYDCQKQSIRAS